MNDDIRKAELNFKRDVFIKDLTLNPIDNDRFTATFTIVSPHSGDVVFQDKLNNKTLTAKWGAQLTSESIVVNLIANSFLILEAEYDAFKEKVDETLVIY